MGSRKQTMDQPGAGAWSQAGDRLPPTQGRVLRTQKPPLGQSVGFSQLSCFPVRPRVCQGTTSPRAVPAQELVHVAALASAGDPTPVPRTHCTWLLTPKWPRHAHSAHGHS